MSDHETYNKLLRSIMHPDFDVAAAKACLTIASSISDLNTKSLVRFRILEGLAKAGQIAMCEEVISEITFLEHRIQSMCILAQARQREGNITLAETLLRGALSLVDELGDADVRSWHRYLLVSAMIQFGLFDEAELGLVEIEDPYDRANATLKLVEANQFDSDQIVRCRRLVNLLSNMIDERRFGERWQLVEVAYNLAKLCINKNFGDEGVHLDRLKALSNLLTDDESSDGRLKQLVRNLLAQGDH